ncbi:hypothetical protein C8R43DRAFT_186132 [Mycena crocata]|nr:hypothetical protein C8R43DRAFT_186132 [Mycena crocata]
MRRMLLMTVFSCQGIASLKPGVALWVSRKQIMAYTGSLTTPTSLRRGYPQCTVNQSGIRVKTGVPLCRNLPCTKDKHENEGQNRGFVLISKFNRAQPHESLFFGRFPMYVRLILHARLVHPRKHLCQNPDMTIEFLVVMHSVQTLQSFSACTQQLQTGTHFK